MAIKNDHGQYICVPRNYIGKKNVFYLKEIARRTMPAGGTYVVGLFRCPECGKPFVAGVTHVLSGTQCACHECTMKKARIKMSQSQIKYQNGDYVGPSNILLVERDEAAKEVYGPKHPRGFFKCPICSQIFNAEINKVASGRMSCCPTCHSWLSKSSLVGKQFGDFQVLNYIGKGEDKDDRYFVRCVKCNEILEMSRQELVYTEEDPMHNCREEEGER